MLGFRVDRRAVSDEQPLIEAALREAARDHTFIISTGGTGLTPRDVTPQATLAVVDYEVPGLAEAMRAAGRAITPMADLSRGVVGVVGRSLVVNVPGSPKAAVESLAALESTLGHALETLAGPYDHDAGGGEADQRSSPNPVGAGVTTPSVAANPAASTPSVPDANPDPELGADAWVPIKDDNDEWRDLPERGPG
jgi:molybdenum cofactor synthesis domain-containing protein